METILSGTIVQHLLHALVVQAVALARSIFRKGGDFTAAMAFELVSTNLVAELGIWELPRLIA